MFWHVMSVLMMVVVAVAVVSGEGPSPPSPPPLAIVYPPPRSPPRINPYLRYAYITRPVSRDPYGFELSPYSRCGSILWAQEFIPTYVINSCIQAANELIVATVFVWVGTVAK